MDVVKREIALALYAFYGGYVDLQQATVGDCERKKATVLLTVALYLF
ncbi:hypothetical protein [Alkalibacillus almallahensis]|nr:hypothetical protein [Alkalibacillus almallahensis]NIK11140.1 hypothetical protein [Alkalibacillus almallahensis]